MAANAGFNLIAFSWKMGEACVSAGGSHSLTVWDAIFISLHLVNGIGDWPQLSLCCDSSITQV
jgi:TRAP-type mannitol/chloroaromatic compound transport system permease small subunit